MRDAQLLANLAQVTRDSGPILQYARAADDFQVRDLCQVREDLVLHTVGKEGIVFVGAEVLEGENSNALVRNRDALAFELAV